MRKIIVPLLGIVLGGTAGYIYWLQVGCSSGTCLITSKPLNSTLYGAFMGYLLLGIVEDLLKKKN